MSIVRKFRPPNRLGAMIRQKGGVLAKDAIAAAEAGVESLREASLKSLDDTLVEMETRFGPKADRSAAVFEDLYVLCLKMVDVAGFAADVGVDKAVLSFCNLVDSCAEAGVWRWDAIDVHLNALRLLRSVGAQIPAADRANMLEGLYKVSGFKADES
jgi:hypothetical protein